MTYLLYPQIKAYFVNVIYKIFSKKYLKTMKSLLQHRFFILNILEIHKNTNMILKTSF